MCVRCRVLRIAARIGSVLLYCLLIHSARGVIRDGGVDPANLGQGGWLYLLHNATNHLSPNNISAVTNENSLFQYLKGQGLSYVIVKAATSNYLYYDNTYSATKPVFTSNLVNVAHANGMKIFGSNRSSGGDIPGEIAMADYVFNQGADGFIYDAETEWETGAGQPWITNGPAQAWWLCGTVRSNWPTKFIAHNPYDTLYLHSSFPYKEFGYWCDAVMPQVYHHAASQGNAFAAIHWTDVNYKKFQDSLANLPVGNSNGLTVYWTNAIKPLVLMRDVYGANFNPAYPAVDVRNFLDYLVADPNCVTAGGYQGSDYFRSELHDVNQWAYIKASTIGVFSNVVNNIILDDARAAGVGSWTLVKTIDATTGSTVSFTGEFGTDTNSFGTNYWKAVQGTGSGAMQFTPAILTGGDYLCYQWHPYRADASASVPHLINFNGGATTVYANQQTNPGNWSLLGRFNFAAGTSGYIQVTDDIPESGGVAMVDGLKLVFVRPTSVPAAPSGLGATAANTNQIDLAWTDNATNETTYFVAAGRTAGGPYTNIAALPARSTNYSHTGLSPATAYYYIVWATNYLGASPTSAEATATTLDVAKAPSIIGQPQDRAVTQGASPTFTVTATGTAPLYYQWRLNTVPIDGATDSAYTRNNAQPDDAGSYSVVVTNSTGSATSSNALLTVNCSLTTTASTGGSVGKSPDQATYTPNTVVTLTATADTGYAFIGWGGDAGGTNNPLPVTMTSNKVISATFVSTATDIILDNTNAAVTFIGAWQSGSSSTDKYGPDYRFASSSAAGTSNATYRPYIYAPGYYDVSVWYPQGANRATNAPWRVVYDGGSTNVAVNQTTNGGGWRVIAAARPFAQGTNGYASVSNNTGYSGSVVLADAVRFSFVGPIAIAPVITQQPQSQTVTQGVSVSFTVAASGTAPFSYQWAFNSVGIASATDSSYTLSHAQPTNAGSYSVIVSNSAGSAASSNALLTVYAPPTITSQPQSVTAAVGSNVIFSVSAAGTLPLGYQWRFNGTNLAAGTASAYACNNVHARDAGSYSVVVSNVAGTLTSSDAVLTVTRPSPSHIDWISLLPNGQVQLQVSGAPGDYTLEKATNLVDWAGWTNFTITNSPFQCLDPEASSAQRFYRALQVP